MIVQHHCYLAHGRTGALPGTFRGIFAWEQQMVAFSLQLLTKRSLFGRMAPLKSARLELLFAGLRETT